MYYELNCFPDQPTMGQSFSRVKTIASKCYELLPSTQYKKLISDKSVADCIEALIGIHLVKGKFHN